MNSWLYPLMRVNDIYLAQPFQPVIERGSYIPSEHTRDPMKLTG